MSETIDATQASEAADTTAISNALAGYVHKTTTARAIDYPAFERTSRCFDQGATALAQDSLRQTLHSIWRNKTVVDSGIETVRVWSQDPSQAPTQQDHRNAQSYLDGTAASYHNEVSMGLTACGTSEDQIRDIVVNEAVYSENDQGRAFFVPH
ncbi:hypothetical protein IAU59_006030 [Kwoniella sp. CBS 9459]